MEYLGTVLVLAILIAVIALIIFNLRKDKKAGKCSCGHTCAGCANAGMCHGGSKPQAVKK